MDRVVSPKDAGVMDFNSRDHATASMAYLQECWVGWNCLTSILIILVSYFIHTSLCKHNSKFYGKASLLDKFGILLNLDFAVVYAISIVPFTYASVKTIWWDVYSQTVSNAHMIDFGLNTLATLFLIEGILIASIRPNKMLMIHHIIFYLIVFMFSVTKSPLILKIGLVLGCFTTWQIFPRVTASLRFLGVRRRTQKVCGFFSVAIGVVSRAFLGPSGLFKVLYDEYVNMQPGLVPKIIFWTTFFVIFSLLYIEVSGVLKHISLYKKLKDLAQQSLMAAKQNALNFVSFRPSGSKPVTVAQTGSGGMMNKQNLRMPSYRPPSSSVASPQGSGVPKNPPAFQRSTSILAQVAEATGEAYLDTLKEESGAQSKEDVVNDITKGNAEARSKIMDLLKELEDDDADESDDSDSDDDSKED